MGTVITFDEAPTPAANGTPVTDQWSGFNVTFGPGLQWDELAPGENWGGVTGGSLFHSYGSDEWQELTVQFAIPVMAAGFDLRAGDATRNPFITFSAFSGSNLIESFSTNVPLTFSPTPEQFYGFTGIVFDRITIDMPNPVLGPPCCGANLDNVSIWIM